MSRWPRTEARPPARPLALRALRAPRAGRSRVTDRCRQPSEDRPPLPQQQGGWPDLGGEADGLTASDAALRRDTLSGDRRAGEKRLPAGAAHDKQTGPGLARGWRTRGRNRRRSFSNWPGAGPEEVWGRAGQLIENAAYLSVPHAWETGSARPRKCCGSRAMIGSRPGSWICSPWELDALARRVGGWVWVPYYVRCWKLR